MPEFLAETYAPRGASGTAAPRAVDIALAAEQASRPGGQVRFLGAIVVPEEETCFWLYQAPSADAVRGAMTRARLRPDRITPAVSISPPLARPAAGTGGTTRPPAPPPDQPDTSSRPSHHTRPASGTGPP